MHDDERDPRDEREANDIDDGSDDLLIRRISRELQAPAPFAADFDARVMAAVRAAAADDAVERRFAATQAGEAELAPAAASAPAAPVARPGLVRRAAAWVARPRPLSVSPLAGLAVAAGLVFMFAVGRRSATTGDGPSVVARADTGAARDTGMSLAPGAAGAVRPVASTRADAPQMVAFVLVAPDARQVSLVGDFNDWNAQATPLTPVKRGGVWTITVPLKPGRYNYNFVVDGTRWMPDPAAPAAPTDDFGTPASIVTVAGAQS